MDDTTKIVCIAFPLHEGDRRPLRKIAPLPAIVPNSVAMPCSVCGMTLAVGPRSASVVNTGVADAYCPKCGLREQIRRGFDPFAIGNLGNPDSKLEDE